VTGRATYCPRGELVRWCPSSTRPTGRRADGAPACVRARDAWAKRGARSAKAAAVSRPR
jgi:hypothetical protein